MQFGLSEEQTLLQDNVNRFLRDQVDLDTVRAFCGDQDANDQAIWRGLVELGISALLVPEANGGVGLAPLDAAIVAECLGYHVTPAPFLGSAVMAPTVLQHANKEQDERLTALAAGELRVGIAFGEAVGARADAQINGSSGKLNGKSLFAFDADADSYLVADKQQHIYWVEAADVERAALTTVDKTRRTVALTYQDSPAELISDDPGVFARALDIGRVMLAADTLGAAQNMLDQAVAYAKQREQFNRPIASFQAVKHMCAEMAAGLEPCRAMVWFAAHALAELPDEARVTACHTKAHVAEVGKFVAKTATEVHGGMGFTDLLGLHYWFKRCGANRQWLGAPELVREEAARLQGLVA
ncbi:MAG: acyl-CoA dehydrogenase family protein [Pseudomonadota bacterium]